MEWRSWRSQLNSFSEFFVMIILLKRVNIILTICKHFLLRCLRSRFKFFWVLIFIEILNLYRVNVLFRMLFECVLIVFDRCLTLLIEMFWMMFDCLNTFCKLCLYIRFQQRISRQNVSLSLSILLNRHDESMLFRRFSNVWRTFNLFLRRSLWFRHFFRSRSSRLFISSSTYQFRVIASLFYRYCLSWFWSNKLIKRSCMIE